MYIKLTLLDERDYDMQIQEFENIGYFGYILECVKSKLDNWKFIKSENMKDNTYDIPFILLKEGYMKIPNKHILKYDNIPIKKETIFTKNCANEMYYIKYLVKI